MAVRLCLVLAVLLAGAMDVHAEDSRRGQARSAFDAAVAMWDRSPSPLIDTLLRRALSLHEAAGGAEDRMAAQIRNRIGRNAYNGGTFAVAEQMFRDAVRLTAPEATRTDLEFAAYLGDLGAALREQRRYREARDPVCRSLAIRRAAVGPAHPLVAQSLNNLGRIALAESRPGEAYALMDDAYAINHRAFGADAPGMKREKTNLDQVRQLAGGRRDDVDPCGSVPTS